MPKNSRPEVGLVIYMNDTRHHNYMQKNTIILMVLAIFNALVAVALFVGFVILFKQNPILCFKHSCSNDSYPFQIKGLSEAIGADTGIASLPEVAPITAPVVTPTVTINKIATPVNNKEAVDDFSQKQYIQSLVTPYKTNFLGNLVVPPEDPSLNGNLREQISTIQAEIRSCANGCGDNLGGRISNPVATKTQINLLKNEATKIDLQMSANTSTYKKTYKGQKLKEVGSVFCSTPQIIPTYKDYCLSLF